jgi:hypothetical protein
MPIPNPPKPKDGIGAGMAGMAGIGAGTYEAPYEAPYEAGAAYDGAYGA